MPEFYRLTDHEQLIEQTADQLKNKLLEKPRQIQQEMESMKNRPQDEGERRMRQELDRFRPRW